MTGVPNAPRVRASYARILLERLDRSPAKADVRARLSADSLCRIVDTPALAFLDGADFEALLEAAGAALDDDALVETVRWQTRVFRDSPMMAGTVRTLLGL